MQSKRDALPARWMARSSWHGWNGRAQVNSDWRSEFLQNRTRSLDLRVILIERVNGFIERAPEHRARAHFFPESVPPVKRKHHPAMSGADRWGLYFFPTTHRIFGLQPDGHAALEQLVVSIDMDQIVLF
jgi:hypothetical protein